MNSRRKLLKKLKKSNAIKEATELDYNKDGSVQINVGLKDADDFFSPFSYKTYELLDQNVVDYINMCESSIPLNEEISIDIHTENPTSYDMKKRIKSSIYNYDNITATNTDPQYIGGIAGLITNVSGVGALTSNGDIEITLTSISNSSLNTIKGSDFTFDFTDITDAGDGYCTFHTEGSRTTTKGTTQPSYIHSEYNIEIFIGNKSLSGSSNAYIYVNQNYATYEILTKDGSAYKPISGRYTGVEWSVAIKFTGYDKFYYRYSDDSIRYSAYVKSDTTAYKKIEVPHKALRHGWQTCDEWMKIFRNTTFSESIF